MFLVEFVFSKSMKINDKFTFRVIDARTVMVQNVIFPHGFGAGENREGVFFSICRRRVILLAGWVRSCRRIGITRTVRGRAVFGIAGGGLRTLRYKGEYLHFLAHISKWRVLLRAIVVAVLFPV